MRRSKKRSIEPVIMFHDYIIKRASEKREMGKYSTAELYEVAGRHFLRFLTGRSCRIRDITPTMVSDFQCYLQRLRLKRNSVNSYMSSLRALYNAAISDGFTPPIVNPFSHLRLRREESAKRSIGSEEIRRMAALDLHDRPDLEQAADLALFGFMAFGMPFVDIVNLKRENIKGGEIIYNRHKTGTQIRIGITLGMEVLMRKYGNDSQFIFAIGQERLQDGDYKGYKAMLRAHNSALKEIGGNLLGIGTKLTSYVMRHTWASEALAHHVPVSVISQALGHSSEKTTRCYLSLLDQSELNNANRVITDFLDSMLTKDLKPYLRNKSRLTV